MIILGDNMYLRINKKKLPIVLANNFQKRLQGLMGVFPITYGMLFLHCDAIHTFFMKDAIDIVGLNQNNQIIYLYQNLSPNRILRISHGKEKIHILELPKNTSKTFTLGETLFFEDENII